MPSQNSFTLNVQGHAIALAYGLSLSQAHLPMLQPGTPGGPVAQVNANPNDPTQLGLQNLTAAAWTAWMPDGSQRVIQPGQSLRLADGVTLQCGPVQCSIRASAQAAAVPVPTPGQGPFPPLGQGPFPPLGQAPPFPPGQAPAAPAAPIMPHTKPLTAPGGLLGGNSVGVSQLVPILSKQNQPALRHLLVPGLVTTGFVGLLFNVHGEAYILLLAAYLLLAVCFGIYLLCGKTKPWWVLAGTAVATIILMMVITSIPFLWPNPTTNIFGCILIGLREEALKSAPVFGAMYLGARLASPRREEIGVREPLDGVMLATASATGFTALETLVQYVPQAIHQGGEAAGVELLIPRILGEIGGHVAYSGYFGYFIGLAAMRPTHRIQLWLTGWLTASMLHAVWDFCGFNFSGIAGLVSSLVLGGAAFAFLLAAIVKARQLSPGNTQSMFSPTPNKP